MFPYDITSICLKKSKINLGIMKTHSSFACYFTVLANYKSEVFWEI